MSNSPPTVINLNNERAIRRNPHRKYGSYKRITELEVNEVFFYCPDLITKKWADCRPMGQVLPKPRHSSNVQTQSFREAMLKEGRIPTMVVGGPYFDKGRFFKKNRVLWLKPDATVFVSSMFI